MRVKYDRSTSEASEDGDHQLHQSKLRIIMKCCQRYDHLSINWLYKINTIIQKPKALILQILTNQPSEWLEKMFKQQQSTKQLLQLTQYYKYYKMYPNLIDTYHFTFMNNYWIKVKTLYYRKIKKILQIQEDAHETIQKNMTNTESNITANPFKTFYLKEHLISSLNGTNQQNKTIQKILHFMIKKQPAFKTIKDGDKNSKLCTKEKISVEKNKHRSSNQALSHLKSTPSQVISTFSYKPNIFEKKKKINTKSYSNENLLQNQNKKSKGKKLITNNSCANINLLIDNQLNYKRRQKNQKKTEKRQTIIRRQKSKKKPNQAKNHQKRKSNEQSMQITRKSQSNSKINTYLQSHVKAAINKTKNKIKMQKNQILKKIVDSRQSYIKSIDSTCGQVGLKSNKK